MVLFTVLLSVCSFNKNNELQHWQRKPGIFLATTFFSLLNAALGSSLTEK